MAFVPLPTARFETGAGLLGIVRPRAPWHHNDVGSAAPLPRGDGSLGGGCATCGATTPDSSSRRSQRALSLMSASAGGYSRRSSRAGSNSAACPNGTESIGGGAQARRKRGTDNPHSRLFVKKVCVVNGCEYCCGCASPVGYYTYLGPVGDHHPFGYSCNSHVVLFVASVSVPKCVVVPAAVRVLCSSRMHPTQQIMHTIIMHILPETAVHSYSSSTGVLLLLTSSSKHRNTATPL